MVEVKAKTYRKAGKATWETIKRFEKAGEADAWLMKYIRDNKADNKDFNIVIK